MSNDLFDKPPRREIREIPIAPILDMLVAVIFFLLLTGTFIEYTNQTLPPATVKSNEQTSTTAGESLAPRLLSRYRGESIEMDLVWDGSNPGKLHATILKPAAGDVGPDLIKSAQQIVEEFKLKFPSEKVLQLSFASDFSYQHVVSVMDGARVKISDVALISYDIIDPSSGVAP